MVRKLNEENSLQELKSAIRAKQPERCVDCRETGSCRNVLPDGSLLQGSQDIRKGAFLSWPLPQALLPRCMQELLALQR